MSNIPIKDERGAKADEAGEWGPIVAQLNREKREARRDADALRRQLQGAVDALGFTQRTLTDPDLTMNERCDRIEGVVRRTLAQLGR